MTGEACGRPSAGGIVIGAIKQQNDDCLSQIERGIVLFGGALLHLIVGIKILWGTITPYVTSYLKMYDDTITTHRTLHVYTVTFLGQALTMYGGGLLEKRIGARSTALLGTFLISGGTLLASFAHEVFAAFALKFARWTCAPSIAAVFAWPRKFVTIIRARSAVPVG